jgi:hypothetical protein
MVVNSWSLLISFAAVAVWGYLVLAAVEWRIPPGYKSCFIVRLRLSVKVYIWRIVCRLVCTRLRAAELFFGVFSAVVSFSFASYVRALNRTNWSGNEVLEVCHYSWRVSKVKGCGPNVVGIGI